MKTIFKTFILLLFPIFCFAQLDSVEKEGNKEQSKLNTKTKHLEPKKVLKTLKNGYTLVLEKEEKKILNTENECIFIIGENFNDYNIKVLNNQYIQVSKNSGSGLIDWEGNLIIDTKYSEIKILDNKYILVNNWGTSVLKEKGLYSPTGNLILPCKYEEINVEGDFSDNAIAAKLDGKWGYVNTQGKVILPFELNNPVAFSLDENSPIDFLTALHFYKGVAWHSSENQFYLVDTLGHQISEKFDAGFDFYKKLNLAKVRKGKQFGAINLKGEIVIPIIYSKIKFTNSLSILQLIAAANQEGKYGLISPTNELWMDFIFKKAPILKKGVISDGYSEVSYHGTLLVPTIYDRIYSLKGPYYTVFKNDKKSIYDVLLQKEITPFYEASLLKSHHNTIAIFRQKPKAYGLINQGKIIVEPIYTQQFFIKKDSLFFFTKKDSTLIYDKNNQAIQAYDFEIKSPNSLYDKAKQLYVAQKGTKYGFVDLSGNIVIPFEYDNAEDFMPRLKNGSGIKCGSRTDYPAIEDTFPRLASVKKGDELFFINKKNEKTTDIPHSKTVVDYYPTQGVARLQNKEKYPYMEGLQDSLGQELLATIYHDIYVNENFIICHKDGKYHFYKPDTKNPVSYQNIQLLHHQKEWVMVKKNNKYGILNAEFEVVFPMIYDKIWMIAPEVIALTEGDLTQFVNSKGMPISSVAVEEYTRYRSNSSKNYFPVVKDKKVGYLNNQGILVIPFEYDHYPTWLHLQHFQNGTSIVSKNHYFGVIDEQNNAIIPFEYELIRRIEKNEFLGFKDGRWQKIKH